MAQHKLKRFLVGNALSNEMAHHERIPKWKALAVLSSDALSSVAYATEEVLIPLALFSAMAVTWSIPIAISIACLLFIVTISYRQTIDAYPNGGGAYTVSKENLGATAGLVAAAALLIDYTLTVSVSVAAGVENIASAFPSIAIHKEMIDILIITAIALLNLRGIRESANIFALPTYFFIFSFLAMIVAAAYQALTDGIVAAPPMIHETYPTLPLFLLLRAFSSGCVALTGIEAISNGVPVFRSPAAKNAKTTMLWMSLILGVFFVSMTLLTHFYGIVPKPGETAVSLLSHAVFGDGFFYYVIQASTAFILILAANTSFADFPRLSSLLAKDRYLPRQMAMLGDRLVFSNGIILLSLGAIALIVIFKGTTHHLIPLYAVGVFLSFTLSQSGMIIHHLRLKEKGWMKGLFFNSLGALVTGIVLVVIAVTKFTHGAWMVVVLIPILVYGFKRIHQHYVWIGKRLTHSSSSPSFPNTELNHIAIVPVSGLHPGVIHALQYAKSISSKVRACSVEVDPESTVRLQKSWNELNTPIPLVVLESPYRSVIDPIIHYVDQMKNEKTLLTIVIPDFTTPKWYHHFLHNQTALLLKARLHFRDVVVTSVRYRLDE